MPSVLDSQPGPGQQNPASEDDEDPEDDDLVTMTEPEDECEPEDNDLVMMAEPEDECEPEDNDVVMVAEPEDGCEPEDEQVTGSRNESRRASRACKLNWVADPKKALLRRSMGIPADLGSRSQEVLSRDFRRDVHQIARIDLKKTWTELEQEGETEGMIAHISTPSAPSILGNID